MAASTFLQPITTNRSRRAAVPGFPVYEFLLETPGVDYYVDLRSLNSRGHNNLGIQIQPKGNNVYAWITQAIPEESGPDFSKYPWFQLNSWYGWIYMDTIYSTGSEGLYYGTILKLFVNGSPPTPVYIGFQ